jgi:hypothetical protein
MRALLLATTAAIALSSAAWAASNTTDASAPNANLRHSLTQMLQKSGYSDIRVAPTSFMVHAKDENGDPVFMSISPDRFAEMTAVSDTTRGEASAATRTVRIRMSTCLPTMI